MITTVAGGRPYSSSTLNQMIDDLRQLATDREKCGGTSGESSQLLRAMNVVRRIRDENEDSEFVGT